MLLCINLASAALAALAAVFWGLVAAQKTPKTMTLTADMVTFDWLTVPLTKQAEFNQKGALCAAGAAVLQAIAATVSALTG
jgi:uncharacterized membrane protein